MPFLTCKKIYKPCKINFQLFPVNAAVSVINM